MNVLVCVITAGRPRLDERPTHRLFPTLRAAGFADIEWVIREDHAKAYEHDGTPVNTYPVAWADGYARAHWRHSMTMYEPGGFHGAQTGREWAMRTAEERGYDAVVQLDDNVLSLGLIDSKQPAYASALGGGDMLALLVELSAATNVRMLGAQLSSAPPTKLPTVRVGYPYSVFVEKCGPGRMPYYGPFEEDIFQALAYALHGSPAMTAGLAPAMTYYKEYRSMSGGNRPAYHHGRGVELARLYPANAQLRVGRRTSAPIRGQSEMGVRHFLNSRGFTPVRVTDRARFAAAEEALHTAIRGGDAAAAGVEPGEDAATGRSDMTEPPPGGAGVPCVLSAFPRARLIGT